MVARSSVRAHRGCHPRHKLRRVDAEPIVPTAPHTIDRTIFSQRWSDLTFLHWAVAPGRVAPYLPARVRPDTIDGRSYVGLVPFLMRDIGIAGSAGVPYFGSFCETNVRLYSVDASGRRGVVFVSLDASRLVPVLVARWGPNLPYVWSRMGYRRRGARIAYTCRRRWPGPRGATSRILVRAGAAVDAGPLEHFLTARWGLHNTDHRGQTMFWPNAHAQWGLHEATIEHLDDDLLAAAGFADLARRPPDSVLYSSGADVLFGPRETVDAGAGAARTH